MRNLFRTHRTKEDLKAIADTKPRGVHHTVKVSSSYNETWEHIWKETKKIGLSEVEDRCFISEERYSYDVKLKQNSTETKDAVILEPTNQCKTVRWEKLSLTPVAYEQEDDKSKGQPLENEITDPNYKDETQFKVQKEEDLSVSEAQAKNIIYEAIKLLSAQPAFTPNDQLSDVEDERFVYSLSGNHLISAKQSEGENKIAKKESLQPLHNTAEDILECDKKNQPQDVELECLLE